MHVEDRVSRQASTSETTPDLTQASPLPTELGVLRVEVALLRERVAAAERVLAERDQRIRDLRGSLQIIAASIPAEKSNPTTRWPAVASERQRSPVPHARSTTAEAGGNASAARVRRRQRPS